MQKDWKFSGNKSETLLYLSLLYLTAILPFQRPEVPVWPGIALMTGAWLFSGNLKNKIGAFLSNKVALLFSGLYIFYLLGLFYSENTNYALTDLLLKIPLLLFPLVFSSTPVKEKSDTLLKVFFLASLLSAIFCVSRAAYYTYTTSENYLYYYKLSWFFHVGHYAMYLCFAAFTALYFFLKEKHKISRGLQSFYLLSFIFLSVVIILLSARAQIVAFVAVIIAGSFFYLLKKQNRTNVSVLLIVLLVTLVAGIYLVPGTKQRFKTTQTELSNFFNNDKKENYQSFLRFAIWETGMEVIKQNPVFGVGTGDAKDKLLEEAQKKNYLVIVKKNLNYHNQYLQTMAAIGLPGLLLLMGSLIAGFVVGFKHNDYLLLSFFTIIAISFFTESMLERQVGVIFYSFFSALLIFAHRE